MTNLFTIEDFLLESKTHFTPDQINESYRILDCEDQQLLEAWYNTVLDFAALIPVVGSVAEGINLVSYAKQGEYLLAGLCAIGLIPLFGQYVGAGGTLIIKALGKGASLGVGILKPLIRLVARFFPKIAAFFKSSKFIGKFPGIQQYIGKMLASLKGFVTSNGAQLLSLSKQPQKIKALKREARNLKQGVKITDWLFGSKPVVDGAGQNQIPVPKDAYLSYQGVPLKNIRPYTDMEISQAGQSRDWTEYLA